MLPKKFNEGFAVFSVVVLLAVDVLALWMGWADNAASVLVGATIVWLGNIYQYFYRKAPPTDSGTEGK